MADDFAFTLARTRFDVDYAPAKSTRLTTNFANLARGENREANLRNCLAMINARFNTLASWDNPNADRYQVDLDIVSIDLVVPGARAPLPLIEMLETQVVDRHRDRRLRGIFGNNLSSFIRDYDFSVALREFNQDRPIFAVPDDFGDLHGKVFQKLITSDLYRQNFAKLPVICLSVACSKTYQRIDNIHPVLGQEFVQPERSLTDVYFEKMGLRARYFMPATCMAPLAFYFAGDLLQDYTDLELFSAISTMDSFQRIYRPEIYNANSPAGRSYRPSLEQTDFSLTRINYDRDERTGLATTQGRFAHEEIILPYAAPLSIWAAA